MTVIAHASGQDISQPTPWGRTSLLTAHASASANKVEQPYTTMGMLASMQPKPWGRTSLFTAHPSARAKNRAGEHSHGHAGINAAPGRGAARAYPQHSHHHVRKGAPAIHSYGHAVINAGPTRGAECHYLLCSHQHVRKGTAAIHSYRVAGTSAAPTRGARRRYVHRSH